MPYYTCEREWRSLSPAPASALSRLRSGQNSATVGLVHEELGVTEGEEFFNNVDAFLEWADVAVHTIDRLDAN
jgi:hypothetical protein